MGKNQWIDATCNTNLDDYQREQWPNKFAALPRKGDFVTAKSGVILQVVSIAHMMKEEQAGVFAGLAITECVPHIKIELHRICG